MCGIVGILPLGDRTNTIEDAKGRLTRMRNAIAHRGPDDSGEYFSGPLSLGHTRLSIIDLSMEAHQPMVMGQDALVFNGEIYNYQELANEYSLPHSTSDTVVLLQLLQRLGKEALPKLRGFFTFAYWNGTKQTLLLARDRFGKKPLYYSTFNNVLTFSSELRSLLSSGLIPFELSKDSLSLYLAFYSVPAPYTLVEHIAQLEAGHYLEIDHTGNVAHECWWRLPVHDPISIPREEIKEELRRLMLQSIRYRMISDVPVGAFLSGGIDSNVIVAAMAKESSERIRTFTIDFESATPHADEISYAKIGAKKYKTLHHERRYTASEVRDLLPKYFYQIDEPTGDGINSYLASLAARESDPNLKVILSGVGSDELLLGYRKFRLLAQMSPLPQVFSKFPVSVRKGFRSSAELIGGKLRTAAGLALFPLETRILFSSSERERLIASDTSDAFVQQVIRYSKLPEESDPVIQLQRLDIENYMTNMLLRDLDITTMAHQLEGRSPFLDREVVDFCWQIPYKEKAHGSTKALLVEAFSDLLPTEIQRKKKTGFEMPLATWLRSSTLRPYVELLRTGSLELCKDGWLNATEVASVAEKFLAGESHYLRVWTLIVLEFWYCSFTQVSSYEDWCRIDWGRLQ